jgi:carboxypeptidase C (cathepsin A)
MPHRQKHRARLGAGGMMGGALNDYPCGGGPAMDIWVNQSAVRKALHVPANAHFYSFDNAEGFKYVMSERSMMPFYKHLATETDVRVLIYNGDTDPGLNTIVAQNWTSALGLRTVSEWRPWTVDGRQRMGGYVVEYEGDFSFLTIRGAGHMVPEYKPAASFEFLARWLSGKPFQPFGKPGSAMGATGPPLP